jgi:hypothetical protein
MKTGVFLISVLIVLSVGCAPAARTVANEADDAVRLIGDDVARFASKYGDDIARTSQEYADDVGRQTQYSDEAVRYWEETLLSSQTLEKSSLVLLYQDQNLTPLQANFVKWLREETILTDKESLLYLQTVCSITDYVQFYNKYPSKSATQFYVEQVAAENHILVFQITDFTESAINYTYWLITGEGSYSQQDGASLLFQGLCLVSQVVDQ